MPCVHTHIHIHQTIDVVVIKFNHTHVLAVDHTKEISTSMLVNFSFDIASRGSSMSFSRGLDKLSLGNPWLEPGRSMDGITGKVANIWPDICIHTP